MICLSFMLFSFFYFSLLFLIELYRYNVIHTTLSIGTDLQLALRPLLLQAQHRGSPSSAGCAIVLITDAQLAHPDATRALLRAHNHQARLFVMACGDSVRYAIRSGFGGHLPNGRGKKNLSINNNNSFSKYHSTKKAINYQLISNPLLLLSLSRNTARSLARTAGGATEFVTATTRSKTAHKVKRQLGRALQPGTWDSKGCTNNNLFTRVVFFPPSPHFT